MKTSLTVPEVTEQAATAVVNETVEQALAIEVRTPAQQTAAVEFLSQIAAAKRKSEAARVFIVGPLNAQIKAINARFKETTAPLDEADQVVREKLLTFQEDEQRRVAAEQARIDAQRRAEEAAAEQLRREQQIEADRVEREAREVEESRQAHLRDAANERAREIAMMSDFELETLVKDAEQLDVQLAEQEMSSRLLAREAQTRADDARRQAEEAQQREIAAKAAPASVVVAAPLAAASGSASVRREWKATAIDRALLPDEYLIVDEARINREVRAGAREIPGVTIEQVTGLSVRAGR